MSAKGIKMKKAAWRAAFFMEEKKMKKLSDWLLDMQVKYQTIT
jgi:hypothetical protein